MNRRSQHSFGGSWTDDKLSRLRRYLTAYTTALKGQRFKLAYIDAFAGTGYRTATQAHSATELFAGSEGAELAKGSAQVALEVNPPFHGYIFIESDAGRFNELCRLKEQFPERHIRFLNQDANVCLLELFSTTDWRTHRAVAFLDPYGMQVEWSTISKIAATQSIDLWYLFPVGMVLRLTPYHGRIPDGWVAALNKILPNENWREEFYQDVFESDLFGHSSRSDRRANVEAVESYLVRHLKMMFAGVASKGLQLRNSAAACIY